MYRVGERRVQLRDGVETLCSLPVCLCQPLFRQTSLTRVSWCGIDTLSIPGRMLNDVRHKNALVLLLATPRQVKASRSPV